jgi:hypothetical protein
MSKYDFEYICERMKKEIEKNYQEKEKMKEDLKKNDKEIKIGERNWKVERKFKKK